MCRLARRNFRKVRAAQKRVSGGRNENWRRSEAVLGDGVLLSIIEIAIEYKHALAESVASKDRSRLSSKRSSIRTKCAIDSVDYAVHAPAYALPSL